MLTEKLILLACEQSSFIASRLSAAFNTSDSDQGAFDSQFCVELEELIIETLTRHNAKKCSHQWEYLGNSIYKQCSQCEIKVPKNS